MEDEMLLSSWYDVHSTVPPSYVQLPENRPGKVVSSLHEPIPVIDLGERDRAHLTQQILKASQEYGSFQVINHGVSHHLMDETLNIFKEFHAMPPKEKINQCSKDPNGNCKIYTSGEN
ncbi:Hyoscyamine 6-dioxygenase [Vigna angularis]|uniref:Hyoscyamine 6-dioxygenase n=1 Tax=Phaseolus angularis TaxID=3914 RepID=A0A8T0JUW5_PHAAN|nr:Hyoscyamine 6-dioxygenase [Vigna angularis]